MGGDITSYTSLEELESGGQNIDHLYSRIFVYIPRTPDTIFLLINGEAQVRDTLSEPRQKHNKTSINWPTDS